MTDVAIVGAGYVGVPLAQVFVEAGKTERIQKILDLFGIDEAAQDWRALEAFMRDMGPQLIASVKELGLTPQ